ncbi:MAG: serine/threonine protein kinase, partial [Pseudomonadota bacterium]
MIRTTALLTAIGVALAGCGGGDINIDPSTTVTNSNNTTTTVADTTDDASVCASYLNASGQTIAGVLEGNDCRYAASFVDAGNNLTVDLTIPALENGGAHIFEGSLFVGESFGTDAELAAAGITEGGDGPVLTVEPGETLAFQSAADFMIINRGSQLFAVGTASAPITFTSVSDVTDSLPSFDAVQQWGGMVINGFGITNKCEYTANAMGELETTDCHVRAEGAAGLDESFYGGDNNDDSSGRLEYVVVKHTGATVGNGDEL